MTAAEFDLWKYIRTCADVSRRGHVRAGRVYANLYDLLDRHGRTWTVDPAVRVRLDMPRACFANAYRLARRRRRLRYVEGYAAAPLERGRWFPTHHAWCVDTDDRVVDPTWSDGAAYIGVVIPVATMAAIRRATKLSSALDNWRYRTIFERPFEPEDR